MALLFFELDHFLKSCRHLIIRSIGVLAWTWAIFVFCLSYIGRSNSYNNNDHYYLNNNHNRHGGPAPSLYRTVFLPILKVLLVAPSVSLAGPLPDTGSTTTSPLSTTTVDPSTSDGVGVSTTIVPQSVQTGIQHPVVIPWGQGVAVGGDQLPAGGFIYCAGCSPINPGQVVIPTNVPYNLPSASGVIPPPAAVRQIQHNNEPLYTIEQQLNGLGGGGLQEPGKGQNIWDDGSVPVQQMALHDDGRYSFAYSTAHSSRQEERTLEGNVAGSYSYTDPEGKLVQIDYTAGPQGYQAYGENVPQQPVLQLPQPVQDTLEVQMARQQFLDTYNRELERIHRDQEEAAARAATASPVSPAGLEDNDGAASQVDNDATAHGDETEGGDDALVISGKTEGENADGSQDDGVTTDEQADSVVIDAQGDGHQDDEPAQPIDVRNNLPDPSYQITIPIGVGGNQGLSVQQAAAGRVQEEAGNNNWIGQGQQVQQQQQPVIVQQQPVQQIAGAKKNIQPYFYYVSVGGQPHYVTSSSGQAGYNSPYPTSLKATLLGAQPLAAVHDVQVPNRGGSIQQQQQQSIAGANYNRPVYLDLENSLKLDQGSAQQAGQAVTVINPASLFSVANNNNQNNPVLGQLVPLSLSPGNTATIGYIPAIILNNNNGQIVQQSSLQESQSSQQQQQFNVPLIQQQQVPSAVPSLDNNDHQSVIVSASK